MFETITTIFHNDTIIIEQSSFGGYIVYFKIETRTIYLGRIRDIDLEMLKSNLMKFTKFFKTIYNKGIEDGIEDGKTQMQNELKNMLGIKGEQENE